MKTMVLLLPVVAVGLLSQPASGQSYYDGKFWYASFDIGGSIPVNPSLRTISGPVTGGDSIELSAGMQLALDVGVKVTPWLSIGGEFGLSYNEVGNVGNWRWPDSSLSQLSTMLNVTLQWPEGPFVPFIGVGGGGVLSQIGFGYYNDYYYYASGYDGEGSDYVGAWQAFAGARYELSDNFSVGVIYRYLATGRQKWDVEWWDGYRFQIGVDSVQVHSICLQLSGSF